MEFKSEAHRKAYDQAREYVYSLFGEVNVKAVDDSLALQEGSTFVYVRAFAIGENNAGVEIFSYVALEVDVTEGLMRYLLDYNLRLTLGAFGLSVGPDGKGTVMLAHTILGSAINRETIYAAMAAIARVADSVDDHITSAYGGKTALAKLQASQPPVEHWE